MNKSAATNWIRNYGCEAIKVSSLSKFSLWLKLPRVCKNGKEQYKWELVTFVENEKQAQGYLVNMLATGCPTISGMKLKKRI